MTKSWCFARASDLGILVNEWLLFTTKMSNFIAICYIQWNDNGDDDVHFVQDQHA